MSAISFLRSRTTPAHEAVDAAFSDFDLRHADTYRSFLAAHARALPLAEARAAAIWPALRRRTPLLAADLAALGAPLDLPVTTATERGPGQWGALYVVEGSRLGGGILSARVGADLPRTYLSAVHQAGEWRAIRLALDAAADGQGDAWQQAILTGALDTFALYAAAARTVRAGGSTMRDAAEARR